MRERRGRGEKENHCLAFHESWLPSSCMTFYEKRRGSQGTSQAILPSGASCASDAKSLFFLSRHVTKTKLPAFYESLILSPRYPGSLPPLNLAVSFCSSIR